MHPPFLCRSTPQLHARFQRLTMSSSAAYNSCVSHTHVEPQPPPALYLPSYLSSIVPDRFIDRPSSPTAKTTSARSTRPTVEFRFYLCRRFFETWCAYPITPFLSLEHSTSSRSLVFLYVANLDRPNLFESDAARFYRPTKAHRVSCVGYWRIEIERPAFFRESPIDHQGIVEETSRVHSASEAAHRLRS